MTFQEVGSFSRMNSVFLGSQTSPCTSTFPSFFLWFIFHLLFLETSSCGLRNQTVVSSRNRSCPSYSHLTIIKPWPVSGTGRRKATQTQANRASWCVCVCVWTMADPPRQSSEGGGEQRGGDYWCYSHLWRVSQSCEEQRGDRSSCSTTRSVPLTQQGRMGSS